MIAPGMGGRLLLGLLRVPKIILALSVGLVVLIGASGLQPVLADSHSVDVGYFNSLFIFENGRLHESDWHPGESEYIPRWEYTSSEPVAFAATFDQPLDLTTPGGTIPPASVEEGTDSFSYSWTPTTHVRAFLESRLVADSGLLLRRVVDPMILPPGVTHVTIDAVVEILRPPSVNGISVTPIGGEFQVLLGESHLLPGARSFGPAGGEPIEVLSSTGFVGNLILGPPFDVGRSFSHHIEVEMLNPNDFEVFFVPSVDAVLDIDTGPFAVDTPGGIALATSSISFDVQGIAGDLATFSFTHPDAMAIDWTFGGFPGFGGFRGIWHRWQEFTGIISEGQLTRGDVEAAFRAHSKGGFAAFHNGGVGFAAVVEGTTGGRINSFFFNGKSYCEESWLVIYNGWASLGRPYMEAEAFLDSIENLFHLDGDLGPLETSRTPVARILLRFLGEFPEPQFGFHEGHILAPGDLDPGAHTLRTVVRFNGVVVIDITSTFFIMDCSG